MSVKQDTFYGSSVAHWFVAQTQAGKEDYSISHLKRQGFQAWSPKLQKYVIQARKRTLKLKPLFPGYVFIGTDALANSSWRSINGTRGVKGLIQFGSRPARVPGELVDELMRLSAAEGHIQFQDSLKPGDQAKVVSGTFDEWIGRVTGLPGPDRVTLLFDVVSRCVSVTVPKSSVVKAA